MKKVALLTVLSCMAFSLKASAQSPYNDLEPMLQWQQGMYNFINAGQAQQDRQMANIEARYRASSGYSTSYGSQSYAPSYVPSYDSGYSGSQFPSNLGPYYMGQRYPWNSTNYSWNRNPTTRRIFNRSDRGSRSGTRRNDRVGAYDSPDRGRHQATQNNVNLAIATAAVGVVGTGVNYLQERSHHKEEMARADQTDQNLQEIRDLLSEKTRERKKLMSPEMEAIRRDLEMPDDEEPQRVTKPSCRTKRVANCTRGRVFVGAPNGTSGVFIDYEREQDICLAPDAVAWKQYEGTMVQAQLIGFDDHTMIVK